MNMGVFRPSPTLSARAVCFHVFCRVLKLLSEDPGNYSDAPREGIRRVLEEVTGKPHPRDKPLDTSNIASIRMGTTVRLQTCQLPHCHAADGPWPWLGAGHNRPGQTCRYRVKPITGATLASLAQQSSQQPRGFGTP